MKITAPSLLTDEERSELRAMSDNALHNRLPRLKEEYERGKRWFVGTALFYVVLTIIYPSEGIFWPIFTSVMETFLYLVWRRDWERLHFAELALEEKKNNG